MSASAFVAVGHTYVDPPDDSWYVVVWDADDGPQSAETTHEMLPAAWQAAQQLGCAAGLPVVLCDEMGPLDSSAVAFSAVPGMAGWGIRHDATGLYVADAYPDELSAWRAAGLRPTIRPEEVSR